MSLLQEIINNLSNMSLIIFVNTIIPILHLNHKLEYIMEVEKVTLL